MYFGPFTHSLGDIGIGASRKKAVIQDPITCNGIALRAFFTHHLEMDQKGMAAYALVGVLAGCTPAPPTASDRAVDHCEYLLLALLPTAPTYERVEATVYGYRNGEMTLNDVEADTFNVSLRYDAANLFGTPRRQRTECTFGRREDDRLLTIRSMKIAGQPLERAAVDYADVSVMAREFEQTRR